MLNKKLNINPYKYNIFYKDAVTLDIVLNQIELQKKTLTNRNQASNTNAYTNEIKHQGYDIRHTKHVTLIKVPHSDVVFYFKTFHYFGMKQLRSIFFFPSKSSLFYNSSMHLLHKGMHVPRIIAYGDVKKGFLLERSFLLYPEIKGISIFKLLKENINIVPLRVLFAQVAKELHKLHAYGAYHGDLRPTNILWDNENIGLVDLDKTKISSRNNIHLIVKDLGKLNTPEIPLTLLSRIRFFLIYLRENHELWQKRKDIFKRTVRYSLRKHNWDSGI